MEITETRQGAVTVLKPSGPLVLGDADQFRRHVQDVMTRSLGRLVVDASAVPYVDSQGLEALVATSQDASSGGRKLRICGMGETLREVLELTGQIDRFELHEDVTDAVRSFLS